MKNEVMSVNVGWRAKHAAWVLLVGLSACSSPTSNLDSDTEPEVERATVLEARSEAGVVLFTQLFDLDAYPSALARSVLTVDDDGCLRLESTERPTVLWPKGFRARSEGARTAILNAAGEVVGRTGDVFRMGGGGLPFLHEGLGFTPEDQALAVSRCPGEFWLATPSLVTTE